MTAKQFLVSWAAACLALAALAAAFNAAVDPYAIFATPRIAGLNLRKPAAIEQEALAKVYGLARADPRTIVLGSSRPDLAINPESPAWPLRLRPVYNLSLAGTGTFGVKRFIEEALSSKTPRHIIIAIAFEDFLIDPKNIGPTSPPVSDFERRLSIARDGQPNPEFTRQRIKDYLTASLSLGALGDSVRTLIANRRAASADLTSSGLTEGIFQDVVTADGQYNLFAQKDYEFFRKYGSRRGAFLVNGRTNTALQDLRAILDIATTRGVSVILFIQPEHVDRMEGWDLLCYWDSVEEWKRELVKIVGHYEQNGAAVRLWDFSGYDLYTEETLPRPGDRITRLTWFWEPVHYTEKLGELMLGRMLGTGSPPFGVLLTAQTIEADLASVRSARARFRNDRPEDVKRLQDLYRQVVPANDGTRTASR